LKETVSDITIDDKVENWCEDDEIISISSSKKSKKKTIRETELSTLNEEIQVCHDLKKQRMELLLVQEKPKQLLCYVLFFH
jgi:hypothetical protein